MGFLAGEELIGEHGERVAKLEIDTVSCKHCQAVIKLVWSGSPAARVKQTKYRCTRCDGPICHYCAEVLKGRCSPVSFKIDICLKHGFWPEKAVWIPKHIPTS